MDEKTGQNSTYLQKVEDNYKKNESNTELLEKWENEGKKELNLFSATLAEVASLTYRKYPNLNKIQKLSLGIKLGKEIRQLFSGEENKKMKIQFKQGLIHTIKALANPKLLLGLITIGPTTTMKKRLYPGKYSEKEIGNIILDLEVIKPGDEIVDLGGGGACYQPMLINKIPGIHITSIDANEYESSHAQIETIKTDVFDPNHDPKKYNVLISSRFINNNKGRLKDLLVIFKKHLKKQGHLIISYPLLCEDHKHVPYSKKFLSNVRHQGYNKDFHKDLLENGFEGRKSILYYDKGKIRGWMFKVYQLTK